MDEEFCHWHSYHIYGLATCTGIGMVLDVVVVIHSSSMGEEEINYGLGCDMKDSYESVTTIIGTKNELA